MKSIMYNNRKLIITWKRDLTGKPDAQFGKCEIDTFRNIKSNEAAERLLDRRNKNNIAFATYNDFVIYSSKDAA